MNHAPIKSSLIIVTIIGALAIACGSDDVSEPTSPTTSAGSQNLIDNQALWSAAGIDNYEFVYQRICFCPPEYTTPALIEVRDGAVWSVEYQDSEIHLDAPDTTMFPMITALFDVLTEAHDRNAVKVTVTFSADLGYPEDVDIDYAANIADDELSFTVTEFVRK